jgi:methionyl-tRNA synthetase
MLKVAGWNTPSKIFVHGMLTVNGTKLSKSKGTFINARTYLDYLDPVYLRYYFACKLTNTISDFDLNFEDFTSRVNSDLVGKITNIASRCFQMVGKNFDNELSSMEEKGREIFVKAQSMSESVATDYEERNFSKVILKVRDIADEANKYFDEKTPWKLVKEDKETTQKILTATLNIFRLMAIYLKPILPVYSEQVEKLFYEESYTWESLKTSLENKKVGSFSHLVKRLEISSLEKIIEASKQD